MGRAPCCDKANVKRGPWSPEEDAALRSYVERHGTGGNWIALPQKAGLKRCGKSCRLRWLNYLRPDIKHGGFTEEEDNIIFTLFNNIGSRWSVIASHLPGRTDNDVKNYWNTKLKKRVMAGRQQTNLSTKHSPFPPIPPALPPPIPTTKAEELSMPFDSSFGFSTQDSYRFSSDLPPFPMPGLINQPEFMMNGFVVSPPEDSSAASSSVENWSANGSSVDDAFLSELGFESYSEFLTGYGEVAPSYSSNLATQPQELYQRVTYS